MKLSLRRYSSVAPVTLVALLSLAHVAVAQEAHVDDSGNPEAKAPPAAAAEPKSFITQHSVQTNDGSLSYTVTAEDIFLRDDEGEPTASFFTISYKKDGVDRPEDRPITFLFNGGPGSSSIWLHLGLVGPKLIDIPSDATDPGGPPYGMKENPWTILRASDLVLVDPVGTGFSKALGEKKAEDFWGYSEDAESVAEFIRTFITKHNRWNSPKFIMGESYGGIRSALLVQQVQAHLSIGINGVILISPALNMGTLPFNLGGHDLPYATMLPGYAATAHYHERLPDEWPSFDALLEEVEGFAGTEYLSALFQGDLLDDAEKERIAEKLHRYTGLSKEYILRSDLRVHVFRFVKELLRDEGKVVGFHDSRYVQDELDRVGEGPNANPSDTKISPIYVSLLQSYLRNDLEIDLVRRYVPLNEHANQSWKRPRRANNAFAGFIDVTGQLAQGTKDNETLRVFSAGGYYDLATSYFATEYMLHHSGIDPELITIRNYHAGHMMYLHQPSLESLSNDIVAFMRGE